MPARQKRKNRQAQEGGEVETELAQYEHGEAAADTVAADLQARMREMVLYALEPETAVRDSWSTQFFQRSRVWRASLRMICFCGYRSTGSGRCWRISSSKHQSKGGMA